MPEGVAEAPGRKNKVIVLPGHRNPKISISNFLNVDVDLNVSYSIAIKKCVKKAKHLYTKQNHCTRNTRFLLVGKN